MKVEVYKNYEEVMVRAAEIVGAQVKEKPDCVLGLPTGSTPIGLYENLAKKCDAGELDFSRVSTFNLDEYYPISPEHDQSYRYFMNDHLFHHINIKMENTHVPLGSSKDPDATCRAYEDEIKAFGGVDLQVLGIGRNGHIGFNEPGCDLQGPTHLTDLTDDTLDANSRFFESVKDVPTNALTMGIGTIMRAKKILILITGENKRNALKALLSGKVSNQCPASALQNHNNVTVLCDEAANG